MRLTTIVLILLTLSAVVAQPSFDVLTEGDTTGPGGVEAACQLSVELRLKNTGGNDAWRDSRGRWHNLEHSPGKGSGLCVFTSIEHSGRFQNVRELWGFQQKMTGEEGGGYPGKVDAMMKKYAPNVVYIQHTGGDLEFIYAAIRTGRMPTCTYAGRDMHYGNERIAHMVNPVHLDPPGKSPRMAAILDNNFPGERQIVWMTAAEFKERWLDKSGGWAIALLSPPPPPKPQP